MLRVQIKPKPKVWNLWFGICGLFITCSLICGVYFACAQEDELEVVLDAATSTVVLPKVFKPNIDLSGRGEHPDAAWPQTVAAREVLDAWNKDIGFNGIYRMQLDLWELSQLAKEDENKWLENYESVIKSINDSGGIVMLDIFGTPKGLGEILDKKSPPRDLRRLKSIIKERIKYFSCTKRYSIWYEVWNAPDLEDFFLGRKQEYLNIYRITAEAVSELEREEKIHIPLGGPSISWWFQNIGGNTLTTPERSLIYELIKFCYHYRLPLDFISWHGFSSSPEAEKENTIYNKPIVGLIKDWLAYFNFENTVLIVDEWNFDLDENVIPQRDKDSFVCSSYIPSRLKNMYEAGIDYQLYFSLQDFRNTKEGVVRNVGLFYFDTENRDNSAVKATFNVFKMLSKMGANLFTLKLDDKFAGVIAAKGAESLTLLIYNYIDPNIVTNYLSKNIASLNPKERRFLLNLVKSGKMQNVMLEESNISKLRTSSRTKNLLKKARDLNNKARKFSLEDRKIKVNINNIKQGNYVYQRYVLDSGCNTDCKFEPVQTSQLGEIDSYREVLTMKPYSVSMIILKIKPEEPKHFPPIDNQTLMQDELKLPLSAASGPESQNQESALPATQENNKSSAE